MLLPSVQVGKTPESRIAPKVWLEEIRVKEEGVGLKKEVRKITTERGAHGVSAIALLRTS
jgi:hypothetical protein